MNTGKVLFLFLFSFLAGSIPFGYLICRFFRKIDIRKYGSGNIGATNVYRVCGATLGFAVLFLDILKGFIPVYISRGLLHLNSLVSIITGLLAITGHIFSIFLKGRGGKGVATSFGVIIGLFPAPALLSFVLWLIVLLFSHIVSISSIAASFFLPIFIFLFSKDIYLTSFGIMIFFFIIYTHRENIKRLKKKKENRIILPWEKK